MSNRFTLKVAVHLLLRKGNEILLLRSIILAMGMETTG